MKPICWLVKKKDALFFEPIRDIVRKKKVAFQKAVLIGYSKCDAEYIDEKFARKDTKVCLFSFLVSELAKFFNWETLNEGVSQSSEVGEK